MNWSDWIQFGLAMTGFIAIAYGVANLGERFFGDDAAKTNLKQQAKPTGYRLVIEDAEGWPFRSYSLTPQDAARVVRDFDRIKNR